MKVLKILLISLLGLVLLVGAAAAAILLLVDPNDYRDEIAAQVTEQTGREFKLEGDLQLSLFPWLGLELGATQLANAEGFGEQPMVRVERAEARVKLMPLFSRKVEIDTVVLEGADLNLARNKDGRTNWDDLVERFATEEPTPETEPDSGGEEVAFSLNGFQLVNSRLRWRDATSGSDYLLRDVNLNMGAFADGQTFPLELAATLEDTANALTLALDAQADVNAALEAQQFSAAGLEATVTATGKDLPGGEQRLRLAADVLADLVKGTAQLKGLSLAAANMELSGQLQAEKILETPSFTGQLSSNRFSLRKLMQAMGSEPPETADPEVLKAVEFKTRVAGTTEQVQLQDFSLQLDDTRFTGQMRVGNLSGSKPRIGFTLKGDKLNADRYLAPAPEGSSDKPAPEQSPAEREADRKALDETPVDVAWIRDLDMDGQLTLDELILSEMTLTDISTKVRSEGGVLRLDPATMRLYGGGLRMTGSVDARGKTPQMRFQQELTGVQAAPLQQDLLKTIYLDGRSDLNLQLTTSGATVGALRRALDGKVSFNFKDGAVKGFNLAQTLRKARALYKGQAVDDVAAGRETDFAELTGSLLIENGVARSEDLLASSPAFRLTGKGAIDLVRETLDYTAIPKIVETSRGQGAGDLEDLKGIAIPVRCKGNLFDPQCRIDIEDALKARVKEEARERISEEVEKRAPELLDRLPGLFNR